MATKATRRRKAPGSGSSAPKKRDRRRAQRASRDDYIPADFLKVLCSVRPELRTELIETQLAIAYLVWVSPSKLRRHNWVEEAMTISHKELDQRFGRRRFREINNRLQIFDVSANWSKAERLTRAFRLQPDVQEAVDAYFDRCDSGLISLITADGDRLRTIPKAVASKSMDGITTKAWREAKILNKVPVDRGALQALRAINPQR
jgi:hypothetical protein